MAGMLGQAPAALEVYPHATFATLLGGTPPAKSTRGGLRVRVATLRAAGLVWDEYYDHDSLDALAAALTAWRFVQGVATPLGDDRDGYIWVPVSAHDVLESYGRLSEREAPGRRPRDPRLTGGEAGSRLCARRPRLRPPARHAPHITILLSGNSTMPSPPASLRRGMISRTTVSSRIVLTATQPASLRCEIVGLRSAGSTASTASRSPVRTLSIRPTLSSAAIAPWSSIETSSILRRFSASSQLVRVGDELRGALEHRLDDAELVGAQGTAGLGDLDDRVGQLGELGLGGAPAELDPGGDAALGEPAPGDPDQLGGDDLALEVGGALHRRLLRHGEHPAHLAEALLGVDEVGHRVHGGLVLHDPVVAGEAAVERAVLHVARHLLGAHHHALDVRVVDGREVRALRDGDEEPGATEEVDGRVLEAPLRQSKLECHVALLPSVLVAGARAPASCGRKGSVSQARRPLPLAPPLRDCIACGGGAGGRRAAARGGQAAPARRRGQAPAARRRRKEGSWLRFHDPLHACSSFASPWCSPPASSGVSR